MNWPDDVDGDVFRRMEKSGFDFAKVVDIDFNIDFDHWPLSDKEKSFILSLYPNSEFINPTQEDIDDGIENGCVQIIIRGKVTYDLVMNIQETVSNQMKQIGGWCESWGVLQD